MYRREQVYEATLEYFNGDELATKVWIDKYCLKNNNIYYELTPRNMHKRLAKEFARIENNYQNSLSEQEIFDLLDQFKYVIPGGSSMEGIGNNIKIQSLSNCYVIGNDEDSYGSILKIDEEQVHIMRRRGGVGSDLSHLRPRGAKTTCAADTSTGIVPFAERYSNSTRETAQEGRRGARMISLDITHPDAEEFIDAKLEQGKITGSNISIRITDEFMDCVKNDRDFYQKFPIDSKMVELAGTISYDDPDINEYNKLYKSSDIKRGYYKRIKAKRLWDKIIHNAWRSAEPGILFIDTFRRESPSDCYGKDWETITTNPCGEIGMNSYSSCILLALNLYSYVDNPFTKNSNFNFNLFKKHVNCAQRMIDDIVDLELEKIDQILEKVKNDPESEDTKFREINLWNKIKQRMIEGRRTGLGITAEGDMLAALNLRYGTEEATNFSENLHKIMAVESYKSSIQLAKERGCFPIWDYKKEENNPFVNRVLSEFLCNEEYEQQILDDYYQYGRRNIANLTIAPTGSVSILAQTSSGIEPAFKVLYTRRRKTNDPSKCDFKDETGDMWEEYRVFHHKFVEWYSIQTNSDKQQCLSFLKDCSKEYLDEIIQKSPYYKATSSDVDYIGKVEMQGKVQRWIDHSISVTVNMPENVSEEMVSQVYMKAFDSGCKGVTVYREGSRSGVLISDQKKEKDESNEIIYNDSPKRPQSLICDIYNISRGGKSYTIIVGLLNNKPYEIFALEKFSNKEFNENIQKGELKKVKSKVYQLSGFYAGKKYVVDNVVEGMSGEERKNTRKFSMMLRHGIHPKHIIHQINEYSLITSFDKVVSKVLSTYLEGEKIKGQDICPQCGGKNIKVESGCLTCSDCGWSRCS